MLRGKCNACRQTHLSEASATEVFGAHVLIDLSRGFGRGGRGVEDERRPLPADEPCLRPLLPLGDLTDLPLEEDGVFVLHEERGDALRLRNYTA